MARWMVENPRPVLDSAGFGIIGAKDQSFDPEQRNGGCAKRTRFEGDVQDAALQKFPISGLCGRMQSKKFCMGGRVCPRLDLIPRGGEDGADRIGDNGADRYLAAGGGGGGFNKGVLHGGHTISLALASG